MSNVPQAPQPQDNARVEVAGRNYSRFALQHNIHCLPIDEVEERNYDRVNEIFNELLGRSILPRLNLSDFDEPWVLDCGYGKGAWVDTILREYEEAEAFVVGVDIYTGQGSGDSEEEEEEDDDHAEYFVKKRWNLNGSFRTCRDDPQLRPESFHLINSRFLTDGINMDRWESYVRELKMMLEPKGWLQMMEVHMLFQSDSGLLNRDTSLLHRWWDYYRYSMELMEKNPRVGQQLGGMMQGAGFEQIHASVVRLPIGGWMYGKQALGIKALDLVSEMIVSSSMWPFRRICQPPLTEQQYGALLQGAQAELRQEGLKLYLNVYVNCGEECMWHTGGDLLLAVAENTPCRV